MVMIQGVILFFFYNEYFNEKKLNDLEHQLKDRQILKELVEASRRELLSAQSSLQKYISNNSNKHLKSYFESLRRLTSNLDSINIYGSKNASLQNLLSKDDDDKNRLARLEKMIKNTYVKSNVPQFVEFSADSLKYEFKQMQVEPEVNIEHTVDSVKKKNFFSRLKSAVNGKTDVIREATVITIKESSILDTAQIKADMDSILDMVNTHYINELEKYKMHVSSALKESNSLYAIYENLIESGNSLMKIYDVAVADYNSELEIQYREQSSQNNKMRYYSVMGLMILMFVVLAIVIYLTRLSFLYERRLKAANDIINSNLRFKNRVLGMLSHDIRSPLKIVNILIDRISKKNSDPSIAEYLKSIKFTNSSLNIQANQILEYTRHQDMKIELVESKGNLKDELDSILTSFEPFVESHNNTLECSNAIEPGTIVSADFTKIYQLFANILGNANKFTENGTIRVNIDIVKRTERGIRLGVKISDTGTGISPDDLKLIFEPYYKGVLSEKIDNLGVGLGLNICKEIVDLYGGTIKADSKIGEGTTVMFEINLKL
jgi:signal transduction histidine kinase